MAFKRSGVRFPSPPYRLQHRLDWLSRVGRSSKTAGIAQLVEHNLAKVGVAGSSPVSRLIRDTDVCGEQRCRSRGAGAVSSVG